MTLRFDPARGLIVVPASIYGPHGDILVGLALDTGATTSMINPDIIDFLGYDYRTVTDRVNINTANGVISVPRMKIQKMEALGIKMENIEILYNSLPPAARIDGVLGLDFFKGTHLKIDLRNGFVDVE